MIQGNATPADGFFSSASRLHCQFFEPVIADFAAGALQPPAMCCFPVRRKSR